MPYSRGDIIEVNFDPSLGHEPQKRRPALVVSDDEFNRISSLTFLAPITSTINDYPLHVTLPANAVVHGAICLEQTRSLDLRARKHQLLGALDDQSMVAVLERIGAVFGI
ncbi:MAG: type II toxin-antitoxin system PemK/MazF family toxin [Coriobacteriales bacterium]|nr:type II toxin-antitoxin system PemK/MazF family toxin [Coriobacteriales bacterium]